MNEIKYFFSALRPQHWVKNFLIFLPLIFGKKLFIYPANLNVVIAVPIFSMAAFAAYLVNDILDREKDKFYPQKRLRPVASGKISVKEAKVLALILAFVSLGLAIALNINFALILAAYIVLNVIYSKVLKNILIIDILCISIFFILRILAGSIVAEIIPSPWIILMTLLLSSFLGFSKRYQELKFLGGREIPHRQVLVKYSVSFLNRTMGFIAFLTILTYVLYTLDAITIKQAGNKNLIYSSPFVACGILRYLYLVHKINNVIDPVYILISDSAMQINIVLWVGVCIKLLYFNL